MCRNQRYQTQSFGTADLNYLSGVSKISQKYFVLSGLDFAWSSNGYVYHNKYDNADQLPLGTLQRTGDNILPLVLRLVASPEMANVAAHRSGNLVFFDFLGAFIVRWSEPTAFFLNTFLVVFSLYTVWWNTNDTAKQGKCALIPFHAFRLYLEI